MLARRAMCLDARAEVDRLHKLMLETQEGSPEEESMTKDLAYACRCEAGAAQEYEEAAQRLAERW